MKTIIFDWSGVVRDAVVSQLWVTNYILGNYGVNPVTMDEFRESWEQPYVLFYEKYLLPGFDMKKQSLLYREAISHLDCPKSPIVQGMARIINDLKLKGYFVAVVSSDLPDTLFA